MCLSARVSWLVFYVTMARITVVGHGGMGVFHPGWLLWYLVVGCGFFAQL